MKTFNSWVKTNTPIAWREKDFERVNTSFSNKQDKNKIFYINRIVEGDEKQWKILATGTKS